MDAQEANYLNAIRRLENALDQEVRARRSLAESLKYHLELEDQLESERQKYQEFAEAVIETYTSLEDARVDACKLMTRPYYPLPGSIIYAIEKP